MIKFKLPFLIFCLVTLFAGLVYGTQQQAYRQSANDPQVQISEDVALRLAAGEPVQSYVAPEANVVDIAHSLDPFIIVYSEEGQAVAGNGKLDGNLPKVPAGVLDYAKTHQEDRITWQPRKNVRIAIIVRYYKGPTGSGFVLAGRSLRETEARIKRLGQMVGLGWLIAIVLILMFSAAHRRHHEEHSAQA